MLQQTYDNPSPTRPPDPVRRQSGELGIKAGISRIVTNVRKVANRVQYLERPGRWLIPENVVIARYRARKAEGRTFHGFRVPPGTWRTVLACSATLDWASASEEQVADAIVRVRAEHPTLRSPGPANLQLLVRFLQGKGVLDKILESHRTRAPESPGIPDVFLYWTDKDGAPRGCRFVEVKKPQEPALPSQTEEIAFLRSLGVKAGILRLEERWECPVDATEGA